MPKRRKKASSAEPHMPSKDEMRRYEAESQVVSAFRDTPEFKRATREVVKNMKRQEKEVRQIVTGKKTKKKAARRRRGGK